MYLAEAEAEAAQKKGGIHDEQQLLNVDNPRSGIYCSFFRWENQCLTIIEEPEPEPNPIGLYMTVYCILTCRHCDRQLLHTHLYRHNT